jgi:hypothetical protein
VATEPSTAGAWHAILGMFGSQSRARIVHLRSKLSSTRKGDLSCASYYAKMKGYADEMAVAGKCLDGEDVTCYILASLDFEFNPFVEAFTAKTNPQTLHDLYSQLLVAEARVDSQKEYQQINMNAAMHGGRGGRSSMRCHGDGGFHGGFCGGHGGGRNGGSGREKNIVSSLWKDRAQGAQVL